MITLKHGNLLKADVEALINPVNCIGIMGKGLALQFKKEFPGNFIAYKEACHKNLVQLGKMFIYQTHFDNPKYIINFPTKYHWCDKSRIEDIKTGLTELTREIQILKISSIAIPALGCGLGGLNFSDIWPIIKNWSTDLTTIEIFMFIDSKHAKYIRNE